MIRPATKADASRIAEILIFVKRMNYRRIFQNDQVSFGEMQVLPLALEYQQKPEMLQGMYVYDDGFVKGLVRIVDRQVEQLYVDSFFAGQGIGGRLTGVLGHHHAAHKELEIAENVDQTQHILVIGDAQIAAHLILLDVDGTDDQHNLGIVT